MGCVRTQRLIYIKNSIFFVKNRVKNFVGKRHRSTFALSKVERERFES